MALTQPTLYSQVAFDATQEHIFKFNVIGGDQVIANTLTIKISQTGVTVYSQRQETFSLSHTLPANTLTNGVQYTAFLTTENSGGQSSSQSNSILFYCYSAPTFVFTNLVNGASLTTSGYNFEISYSQSQNEPLEQYTFNLYDFASNLIATSGTLYTNSTTVPFIAQYAFTGFVNNNSYYIECTGVTSQGTQITTGLLLFGVNYNASSTKLNLNNNCNEGYVYISSTPIAIFGSSYPSPPTYIIDGEDSFVDISETGEYVLWDNGFTTSTTDWTLSIWGKDFNENKNIVVMNNEHEDSIKIEYKKQGEYVYCILTCKSLCCSYPYVIYSDSISVPSAGDSLMIWVRRINNLYDIVLTNLEE